MVAYWHNSGLHDKIITADAFENKQEAAANINDIPVAHILSYRLLPIQKEAAISRGL